MNNFSSNTRSHWSHTDRGFQDRNEARLLNRPVIHIIKLYLCIT